MPAFRDLTGRRFGRLAVLYYQPPRRWWVRCECGTEKLVTGHNLLSGATRSCGCLQKETRKANGSKTAKVYSRCPCCGQPAPPLGIPKDSIRLSIMEQALFNIVKSAPHGIGVEAIRERLQLHRREGEPFCHSYVAATASNANKKILHWGVVLRSTGGTGSVYRLVRL